MLRKLSPQATGILRRAITDARENPDPFVMARDAARATTIVGLMIDDFRYRHRKSPAGFAARVAQIGWSLVELAAPRKFIDILFQHWLALLWAAALLLLGAGALLSEHPSTKAGVITACAALAAYLLVEGLFVERLRQRLGSRRTWRWISWTLAGASAAWVAFVFIQVAVAHTTVPAWILLWAKLLALVALAAPATLQWARPHRAFSLIAIPAAAAAINEALRLAYPWLVISFGNWTFVPGLEFTNLADGLSLCLLLTAFVNAALTARGPSRTAWTLPRLSQSASPPQPAPVTPTPAAAKAVTTLSAGATSILQHVIRQCPVEPDRIDTARSTARALTILGDMLEDLGKDQPILKKPGGIIALFGRTARVLVELAVPQSFGKVLFRHIISIAWAVSGVLLLVGMRAGDPPLKAGAFLVAATLAIHISVRALRAWMGAKSVLRKAGWILFVASSIGTVVFLVAPGTIDPNTRDLLLVAGKFLMLTSLAALLARPFRVPVLPALLGALIEGIRLQPWISVQINGQPFARGASVALVLDIVALLLILIMTLRGNRSQGKT